MADTKISALAALTGVNLATGDQFVVVDISDTSMAASGTDKNITAGDLDTRYLTRSVLNIVARTSDTAARNSGNTGSTLTADDTILFAVSGNSADVYHFELFLLFNSVNTTMDAKAGWTVPSGTTIVWGYGFVAGSTGFAGSSAAATSYSPTGPLSQSTAAVWASIGTDNLFARAEGYVFVGGTSGNVVMTWAQNTSDASNLILKKGSHIRLTKVI